MSTSMGMLPSISELTDFATRAADAAALLMEVRDKDIDLAPTPREEIHRIGGKTLYRIIPAKEPQIAPPVFVTYAMVGRWTVLDLQEDRSFLRNLSESGCEVYILDWGHPNSRRPVRRLRRSCRSLSGRIRRRDLRSPPGFGDQPSWNLPRRRVVSVLRSAAP